jgi:hypothetical protein
VIKLAMLTSSVKVSAEQSAYDEEIDKAISMSLDVKRRSFLVVAIFIRCE